jgi:U3 small nucleolar RNA-associated protein 22
MHLYHIFQLQSEAALALTCMSKGRDGGFDEIFMTRVDFPAKYDYCIRYNSLAKNLHLSLKVSLL